MTVQTVRTTMLK